MWQKNVYRCTWQRLLSGHNEIWIFWTVEEQETQLDVTSYYVLFHFVYAQHVSDINTSIIRSLRLFCCISTLRERCRHDYCCLPESRTWVRMLYYNTVERERERERERDANNNCPTGCQLSKSYVYRTVHHCDSWRIKDPTWCHQLLCFISLLLCSTCFRH